MSEPAQRSVSYDDVLDAPDGMTAEILGGELHLSPRPSTVHQVAGDELLVDVKAAFTRGTSGPGGWIVMSEVELHLGDSDPRSVVAVPDVSGWRKSRMPAVPDAAAIELAPDWVCEILSPGAQNIRRDRLLKPDIYFAAGIEWMWLVDPAARLIEVWHRGETGYIRRAVHAGPGEARLPPFDAVVFDTAPWWTSAVATVRE